MLVLFVLHVKVGVIINVMQEKHVGTKVLHGAAQCTLEKLH